ncbi:MAG: hypothetical protein JXM70_30305, partial [Pirellulales bacterium]|nr:hypothetical protein [Pirellulales bacterium]
VSQDNVKETFASQSFLLHVPLTRNFAKVLFGETCRVSFSMETRNQAGTRIKNVDLKGIGNSGSLRQSSWQKGLLAKIGVQSGCKLRYEFR